MITKRKLIYDIRERLDLMGNSNEWTDEYLGYLIDSKRATMIRERINQNKAFDVNKCSQLIAIPVVLKEKVRFESGNTGIISASEIPTVLGEDKLNLYIKVFSVDFDNINFNYVDEDRFRYVGEGKYLGRQVYVTLNCDGNLKLKSGENVERNLRTVQMNAIFADPGEAFKWIYNKPKLEFEDTEYPIDDRMAMIMIELILKEDLIPTVAMTAKGGK